MYIVHCFCYRIITDFMDVYYILKIVHVLEQRRIPAWVSSFTSDKKVRTTTTK